MCVCVYLCRTSHPPAPTQRDRSSYKNRCCWRTGLPDTGCCPHIHSHLYWHTHTHRRHQYDTFTPAVNHRVSLHICHLDEELPDRSEHVRKVMHHLHQQLMTCSYYSRSYCAGMDDCENDCTEIINSSDRSEPPTVLYLHMRARWVPLRSPGHRPCRRRSPLCWCTHPWGTHLASGTRQCLRGRRRRWKG